MTTNRQKTGLDTSMPLWRRPEVDPSRTNHESVNTESDKSQVQQPTGFPGSPGGRQTAEVTVLFGNGPTVPFVQKREENVNLS